MTVLPDEVRWTLPQLISARLRWSRERAVAHIVAGSVYVDGRRQRDVNQRLRPAQKLTVFASPDAAPPAEAQPCALAFLDEDLVVLVKPAGLPAIATRRGGEASVADEVRSRWGADARLLHRLDREVSGLLLVSRRQVTRAALSAQVRTHTLERRYLALVRGRPDWQERTVERPLLFVRGHAQLGTQPPAKPAQTRLQRLAQHGELALLAVTLRTGRPHQIRAHLAAEGFPLLGDTRYGGSEAERVALHAHALGLQHPRGGHWIELHSALPAALRQLWALPHEAPLPASRRQA
ncbi:MAG: RluA family pseudouridine synthase [Proteobacteria bacterium]|nr:RluA family pseudouridine synthase [Pseudomonadota bacterium]